VVLVVVAHVGPLEVEAPQPVITMQQIQQVAYLLLMDVAVIVVVPLLLKDGVQLQIVSIIGIKAAMASNLN